MFMVVVIATVMVIMVMYILTEHLDTTTVTNIDNKVIDIVIATVTVDTAMDTMVNHGCTVTDQDIDTKVSVYGSFSKLSQGPTQGPFFMV